MSPVRNQPSDVNASALPRADRGSRRTRSAPAPRSRPLPSARRTSTPGSGKPTVPGRRSPSIRVAHEHDRLRHPVALEDDLSARVGDPPVHLGGERRGARHAQPQSSRPVGARRVDEPRVHRRDAEEHRRVVRRRARAPLGDRTPAGGSPTRRRGASRAHRRRARACGTAADRGSAGPRTSIATRCSSASALARRLPCVRTTPFGVPVVPDVNGNQGRVVRCDGVQLGGRCRPRRPTSTPVTIVSGAASRTQPCISDDSTIAAAGFAAAAARRSRAREYDGFTGTTTSPARNAAAVRDDEVDRRAAATSARGRPAVSPARASRPATASVRASMSAPVDARTRRVAQHLTIRRVDASSPPTPRGATSARGGRPWPGRRPPGDVAPRPVRSAYGPSVEGRGRNRSRPGRVHH